MTTSSGSGRCGHDHLLERHFKLSQLSETWGWSVDFLRPLFLAHPCVMKVIRPEDVRRKKRGYVSLRIPESAARDILGKLQRGEATKATAHLRAGSQD